MARKRAAHIHSAECACVIGPGHKALAVDPELKHGNQKRLRRIEGQIRGLQKMVADDRYCADIIVQIASVQEALRGVARNPASLRALVSTGLDFNRALRSLRGCRGFLHGEEGLATANI